MLDYRVYGYLAHTYCKLALRVRVCKSAAGWYIGTLDADGCPVSRESEYFDSEEGAEFHLGIRKWNQREHP